MNGSRFLSHGPGRAWSLLAALLLLSGPLTPGSPAATYVWTGGAANENWSSGANWQGGVAPTSNETGLTLVFSNNVAVKSITNDIAGLSADTVRFFSDGYVINGRPTTNSLKLAGAGFLGFNVHATGNGNQFANSCPLALGSLGFVTVSGVNTLKFSSVVSGSGGLAKNGSGTLLFNPLLANSFSGGVTVADGQVDLAAGFIFLGGFVPVVSLPGPLTIGSTNLAFAPLVRLLADHQIADAASVLVDDNARLLLNGRDDTLGHLTVRGGTIDTRSNQTWTGVGTLTLNGNITAQPLPGSSFGLIYGALDLGADTRTFDIQANAEVDVYGRISGGSTNVALIKDGGGMLWIGTTFLGGSNTYAGQTILSNGAVALYDTSLGDTTSGTIIESNVVLYLNGSSTHNETLLIRGSGAHDSLVNFGDCIWAGDIQVEGGVGIYTEAPGRFTLSGGVSGPGGLRFSGDATNELAGSLANTHAGLTIVNSGTLSLGKSLSRAAVPGDLLIKGGAVDIHANSQFSSNSLVTVQAPGELRLNGLQQSCRAVTGDGTVQLGNGYLFAYQGTNDFTFAGQLGGTIYSVFGKFGTGKLTLTADCPTFGGHVMCREGTLTVSGNFSHASIVADGPEGGATAEVRGLAPQVRSLILSSNSVASAGLGGPASVSMEALEISPEINTHLLFDLQGSAPGTGYDCLLVTNHYALGGTLLLNATHAGPPGEQYTLIDFDGPGAHTGVFQNLPEGGLLATNGLLFQITYQGGDSGADVVLTRVSTNPPAVGGVQKQADGQTLITAAGSPRAIYSVRSATNLAGPVVWTTLGSAQAATNGLVTFTDTDAAYQARRFYRLTLP